MPENSFYSQETQGPYQMFSLGDFKLDGGATLPDCKLAYATTGQLNASKDNAILFPHMYSGTSKHMEQFCTGPGLAIDPDKYFIIFPNQLGNGLSTSPSNAPAPHAGARFPTLTLGDDIRAQHRLVTEQFGITRLQLVLGWSMGAQQTYEWAVRHPDMVLRAAPIAGTARCTPHSRLYTRVVSEAITSDPAWNRGAYDDAAAVEAGLRRHARIFALMGASTQLYKEAAWERLGISSFDDFLAGFWENWFLPMDPNNLLCMLSKWQRGDVGELTGGDLGQALGRIRAKTLVMAFEEDMFVPVRDCRAEQELIKDSELCVIPGPWGHFSALGLFDEDKAKINEALSSLLAQSAA
jgi:homoserine O-acetyltransferase